MLKDRTLLTLRYLWEESTKENYATCADIMRYLEIWNTLSASSYLPIAYLSDTILDIAMGIPDVEITRRTA